MKIIPGHSKFRTSISDSASDLVIFASDILSEPQREVFARLNPYSYAKCARALPVANEEDLVVLTGDLDKEYYQWLRNLGFGPKYVHAYGYKGTDKILSDLILSDPNPIKKIIKESGRTPVFVPFYSGAKEKECTDLLEAELFGAEAGVCSKYFNKGSFKEECRKLGLDVVGGITHELDHEDVLDYEVLEELISSLLKDYGRVIIRGEQGSAGSSTFEAKTSDIGSIYAEIKKNQDKKLLIEPMLEVIASPNDQWAIDRKGNIHHLGITAQLFEGLKHAGNLKGQYFSDRTYNQMTQNSLKVVEKMTSDGYCGVLGIDYIIAEQGIYPTENNARVNGSTYTHALVNKVEQQIGKVQFWKFFKAKTSPCSFTELVNRMGSLIYNGTSINHVFPYDCDMLSVNGTFATVLIAEDMYHIDFLEQALKYLEINRI